MPCTGAARKGGTFVKLEDLKKSLSGLHTKITWTTSGRRRGEGEGGGGTQYSFILGRSAERSNTICNFQQKRCPFQIRSLELCMKRDQRTVLKNTGINHKCRKICRLFHSHKILPLALLDLLTDRNDNRFPYTIMYFN